MTTPRVRLGSLLRDDADDESLLHWLVWLLSITFGAVAGLIYVTAERVL
jgi:hypothetical protein